MARNNHKEIEAIFKENYREFCFLSFSYVACMEQAQDIVQDVFVKFLMKDEVSNIVNMKAYFRKSVQNCSLKYVVRNRKLVSIEQNISVLEEEVETRNYELELKVRNAMDKLPPKCKNVIELCVVDGLKYSSAADSLGITVNTVKTQMKKAFRILRQNLSDVYSILIFFI